MMICINFSNLDFNYYETTVGKRFKWIIWNEKNVMAA